MGIRTGHDRLEISFLFLEISIDRWISPISFQYNLIRRDLREDVEEIRSGEIGPIVYKPLKAPKYFGVYSAYAFVVGPSFTRVLARLTSLTLKKFLRA